MSDIETLLAAARQHGLQSEPEQETGDLVDIARFMWSQLPAVGKRRTMANFKELIEEWGEDSDFVDNSDRGEGPVEFTESPRGYRAREKWAERYDELNGAPESEDDR
jgi:hypothetical protein